MFYVLSIVHMNNRLMDKITFKVQKIPKIDYLIVRVVP